MQITRMRNSVSNKSLDSRVRHCIKKRDWASLVEILEETTNKELLAQAFEGSSSTCEKNCLQMLCENEPPVHIVEEILTLCPDAAQQQDKDGRIALHTAAACGASHQVLRRLATVSSAGSKDDEGKTPLIAACEAPGGPSREVVQVLCAASPTTVNDEDEDGMSALEYAIFSGTSYPAVRSLQKACQREWRRRVEEKKTIESKKSMRRLPRQSSKAALAA